MAEWTRDPRFPKGHRVDPDTKYVDVYPFAASVDVNDPETLLVIRDMPWPSNMVVHLANEHRIKPDGHTTNDQHHLHNSAHLHGEFREGAEHFHTKSCR